MFHSDLYGTHCTLELGPTQNSDGYSLLLTSNRNNIFIFFISKHCFVENNNIQLSNTLKTFSIRIRHLAEWAYTIIESHRETEWRMNRPWTIENNLNGWNNKIKYSSTEFNTQTNQTHADEKIIPLDWSRFGYSTVFDCCLNIKHDIYRNSSNFDSMLDHKYIEFILFHYQHAAYVTHKLSHTLPKTKTNTTKIDDTVLKSHTPHHYHHYTRDVRHFYLAFLWNSVLIA